MDECLGGGPMIGGGVGGRRWRWKVPAKLITAGNFVSVSGDR